jgi:hypothetical protein
MKAKEYLQRALVTHGTARYKNLKYLHGLVNESASLSGEQWATLEAISQQFEYDFDMLEILAVAKFINTCHE